MTKGKTSVTFTLPPDLYAIAASSAGTHGQGVDSYLRDRIIAALLKQQTALTPPTRPLTVEPRWKKART